MKVAIYITEHYPVYILEINSNRGKIVDVTPEWLAKAQQTVTAYDQLQTECAAMHMHNEPNQQENA